MSLELLAAMVVVGIGLVVGAVSLLGLSRPALIESEEGIRSRLTQDFPEVLLRDGLVTRDGQAAFFLCADGRVAMARTLGSKYVTRLIDRGAVRRVAAEGGGLARLELDDITFPVARLEFASDEAAARLVQWLKG